MKIEITAADSQRELAEALAAAMKRHCPGLVLKRQTDKQNSSGRVFTHYFLDDGRRW